MAHIFDHFLQISLKTHKSLIQMRFNLQLLQTEHTKQHLLDAWKWGMTEVENQGVGSQVVRAILLTKKESDKIIKQLKLQGPAL
jgi:hypothetical protein